MDKEKLATMFQAAARMAFLRAEAAMATAGCADYAIGQQSEQRRYAAAAAEAMAGASVADLAERHIGPFGPNL